MSTRATWPLQPLLDAAGGITATQAAMAAGFNRHSGPRWARRGHVDDVVADRLAIGLGLHPTLVWDGWWSELADESREVVGR